jgi:hypothetical protein
MAELALNLGSGGSVVGLPVWVGLAGAGTGERRLVAADGDVPTARGGGALGAQRTGGAVLGELGDPGTVGRAADGDGDIVGACDGVVVEVDLEAVLGEQAARRRRRLGPTARCDVLVGEALLDSPVP